MILYMSLFLIGLFLWNYMIFGVGLFLILIVNLVLLFFFRCEIFNGDYKLWGSNSLDIEIWNIVKVSFILIWLIKILKYFIVLF